jgi:hypothetical protein
MPAFVYFDGQATRELTAQSTDSTDLTTYTFASQGLGTETSDRFIVVAINGTPTATPRSVSSVTVGGVSASVVVTANSSGLTEMWQTAKVSNGGPTGTSGTVVVTFSGSMFNAQIAVYAVKGAGSNTPTATATDTSAPLSQSLSVPAGGVAIAGARAAVTPGDTTWGGLTEDTDQLGDGGISRGSSASAEFTSAATPTIAASWGAGTATGLAAAAWA